jgi:hypothetical protein
MLSIKAVAGFEPGKHFSSKIKTGKIRPGFKASRRCQLAFASQAIQHDLVSEG